MKKEYNSTSPDVHHLFYVEDEWNKEGGRTFRDYCYFKVVVERGLHVDIHAKVKGVPIPTAGSRRYIMEQMGYMYLFRFISDGDPIEERLALLISLFEEIGEEATAAALRRQLEAVEKYYKKKGPS